jgi:hypothetical protein
MRPVEHTHQLSILNKGKMVTSIFPKAVRQFWTELRMSQTEEVKMRNNQTFDRENEPVATPLALPPMDDDAGLLALEAQFEALVAELIAAEPTDGELAARLDQPSLTPNSVLAGTDADASIKQAESILARLHPIEQAIMQTPARTIAGLGVKARHAAYVMSHYWEEPTNQIDWEAQATGLLIEAVCNVARTHCRMRRDE